ncbi:hypothetical protein M440DRAFT_1393871 [Trichoderma longibrachiatum ATCC 18648]|uniref:Uncharacterized protein n=1 Tax=Trichoderma longibrachiatum ATCC 18648 TaxID=983965 RepID=A0A2T4BXP6_TRILO|nr:hypothetical protein M440DRAFT_1393871 [Trichoderma longibrachiatum ATCC 18648]
MALYDLNIAWSPATPTDRLLQTLTTAHSLGYTTSEKAMEGLRTIPRGVVVNEGLKRDGFRGVVNIVQVVKRKPAAEGEQTDDQSSAAEQGGKRKNQKRKNGGEDAQPVSKRGAKKMKLAARAAAAEKKAS